MRDVVCQSAAGLDAKRSPWGICILIQSLLGMPQQQKLFHMQMRFHFKDIQLLRVRARILVPCCLVWLSFHHCPQIRQRPIELLTYVLRASKLKNWTSNSSILSPDIIISFKDIQLGCLCKEVDYILKWQLLRQWWGDIREAEEQYSEDATSDQAEPAGQWKSRHCVLFWVIARCSYLTTFKILLLD